MKHLSKKAADTQKIGKLFGEKSEGGEVFLLTGELGSGKTQFVKGLAEGLGVKGNITSPTFTYEKIYKGRELTLYHFDLYREEKLNPDIELLMKESFADRNGVVAIEWAERAKKTRPLHYFKVQFNWKNENEREIEISQK